MREIYSKAHDYIACNQSVIDLIESETAQLEKDIIAMWVAGYVRRELEEYTGKEKSNDYYVHYTAMRSLTMTVIIDNGINSSTIENTLINSYKEGYNTRENEGW